MASLSDKEALRVEVLLALKSDVRLFSSIFYSSEAILIVVVVILY
jgi:hypothetical protein